MYKPVHRVIFFGWELMGTSYMFYIILLWITFIFVSLAITLLFDRRYHYVAEFKGLSFWRHWWHSPILLILALVIGLALGFGLTFIQILGFPPGPDTAWASSVGLMFLWSIIFTVIHGIWLLWQHPLKLTQR